MTKAEEYFKIWVAKNYTYLTEHDHDELDYRDMLKFAEEYHQEQLKEYMNPELKRDCIDRIKNLSKTRIPQYQQPADSFIEECVLDIYSKIIKHNQ